MCIVTKGAAVMRDADILGRMAQRNLARVMVSVTTLDRELPQAGAARRNRRAGCRRCAR
ncbi:MAG: hypothetical protein U5L06_15290 [Rhodovibrio sp.]|nr:hypothetical protein [Rhodovibrio sp.]